MKLTVRNEETKRSVTYQVPGMREDGQGFIITLIVSAQCQTPGSAKAVADLLARVRGWIESGVEDTVGS